MKLPVESIIFRKDLYPRSEGDAQRVESYGKALAFLPPIEINQNNELIDGWHRWMAHKEAKQDEIAVVRTRTDSDAHLLELAIERNAKHGLQLSLAEKRSMAIKIYEATTIDARVEKKVSLAGLLSVDERTVHNWVLDIDQASRGQRDALIMRLYLEARTQEEIAAAVGVDQKHISRLLGGIEKFQICLKPSDFDEVPEDERAEKILEANQAAAFFKDDFSPPIYNIWSFGKKTNATTHFGNTEQRIVENLLWLYTEPFSLVVDPFAGGGSTLDVCRARLRRCWLGDRKPRESKADVIREHDICHSLPRLPWSEVSLVYLDPPYWKQAEGKYSDDAEDLANMPLQKFTSSLSKVVSSIAAKLRKGSVIALIVQPTQWNSEPKGAFTDHVFDVVQAVGEKKLQVENRISCPYSTEQCLPQMVEWSKAEKKPLVLTRELVIWRRR